MRTARRHPKSHTKDGSSEANPPDQWLGGEAHVRFQRGRSWRDLFQRHRRGMAGLALAFLVGMAIGTGLTTLTLRKR